MCVCVCVHKKIMIPHTAVKLFRYGRFIARTFQPGKWSVYEGIYK